MYRGFKGALRGAIAVALTGWVVGAPSSALASSTIGQDFSSSGSGGACPGGLSTPYMDVQTGSPGNAYAAPYDGVLTSWSSNTDLWGTATLKVVRLGSGTAFTVLAQDGPRASDGAANPIRVSVRQGDVLGLFFPPQTDCPGGDSAASTYSYGEVLSDVGPGPGGFSSTGQSYRIPVTAQIEHDRDGDGYGDETQDGCPSVASTHGSCPLPTVLGQTVAPGADGGSICTDLTKIGIDPPDYSFVAPTDGVVTSWSFLATDVGTGSSMKLKAMRPQGGSQYLTIGEDGPQAPVANQLNTFPARMPMRSGDRIGLSVSGSIRCGSNFAGAGSSLSVSGDQAVGTSATYAGSSRLLDLSAVLEADADGDGYGDTSQDLCPTDATTQGPCKTATPPPDDDNAACDKAKKKLAKAKAKLKKLKKADASAKKVKGAKAKVKKAKDAVKKAC